MRLLPPASQAPQQVLVLDAVRDLEFARDHEPARNLETSSNIRTMLPCASAREVTGSSGPDRPEVSVHQ